MSEVLRYPLSRGLILLNLALAALIVLRLVFPAATLSALRFTPAPPPPVTAPKAKPPHQILDTKIYPEITEKPLFVEARRMPKDKTAPGTPAVVALTPASALDGVTLSGVVMAGGARVALLKVTSGEPPQPLKEGDSFRGWQVARIEAQAVTLTAHGQEKRLEFPQSAQKGGVTFGAP